MPDQPLGRRVPSDDNHIRRYPLTAPTMPTTSTPVTLGVNWYRNFDIPEFDGRRWWIGRGPLGSVRGGHCVCLKSPSVTDSLEWWRLMDQGSEGACVGYGATRMMMLLNRCRYDAHWLYASAQAVDEWTDTPPEEGTSVRAALDVLRTAGHRRVYRGQTWPPDPFDGILENRWATTADEVLSCLQSATLTRMGAVAILNSWGVEYPHIVYMPCETLERLLREDGEATIVTDR